jgi:putative SOS response-associated peptidase YedK
MAGDRRIRGNSLDGKFFCRFVLSRFHCEKYRSMCGRYSLHQTAAKLAEVFELKAEPDWTPRYNIAPSQPVAALLNLSDRSFRLLRWGLIPSWAKDSTIGYKLINARAETVAEKPSFRSAFKQHRCLILADGFYEWKREQPKKQPYYFQLVDGQPFAFAGLWERWQGNEESPIDSCTIITTAANQLLALVHDRMPVILASSDYEQWLDPDTPPEQLHHLLHPYNSEAMSSYPVSAIVNSPTNDSAACIAQL